MFNVEEHVGLLILKNPFQLEGRAVGSRKIQSSRKIQNEEIWYNQRNFYCYITLKHFANVKIREAFIAGRSELTRICDEAFKRL